MSIDFLQSIFWGEHAQAGALILSIVTESLFAIGYAKYFKLDGKLLVITASAATLVTHPILWQLFTTLAANLSFDVRVLILETLVFLVEGVAYKLATTYSWQLSLGLSFGANITSYTCGVLLYEFLSQ
jgi:hypothetical protein